MVSVTLPAYAKVNLHLDVLGKRPDGYHELLTLFERLDLADEVKVTLKPGSGIDIECDHPEVPCDESNLSARAARGYLKALGVSHGLGIRLKKSIPVAAGLGGGSSDAAATLLALQVLTGDALSGDELLGLARGLGADVPFFLAQTAWAIGKGRGDEIEPVPCRALLWHLLVVPGFPIPTRAVYEAFRLTAPHPDVKLILCALGDNHVSTVRDLLYNALEPTVEELYPNIQDVKRTLEVHAGIRRPLVSGSGSAVMAVFASREEAKETAQALSHHAPPSWKILVAATRM